MSGFVGEHFIQCLKCKYKIHLPENPITMQGSVRYEINDNRLSLFAKCTNPACQYDNLYSVVDLLHGRSTEVK